MLSKTYFLTIKGEKSILFRQWDVQAPKACVCLLHGLGNHSLSFQSLADSLLENKISVCAIDWYGHGESYGRRGHLNSFEIVYKELDMFLAEVDKLYPNIPKILYGHGLGGNIILDYYLTHKLRIQGLIISAPWFKLSNPPVKIVISLSNILRFILPKMAIKIYSNLLDFTRDEVEYTKLLKDSLVHNKISFKLYFLASTIGKRAIGRGYRINKPMLLMHGTGDNITSHKASIDFSRNTGHFTLFKSWPEAFHDLHNDVNRNEIFSYVNKWIKDKIL